MADGNSQMNVSNDAPARSDEGPVLAGAGAGASGAAAAKPAMPAHLKPGRKWKLPQPSKYSTKTVWTFAALTSLAMAVLWVAFAELLVPTVNTDGPPPLAKEFRDVDNALGIRPPLNWSLEDPHDGANVYIKGPAEKGFSPLIITSLEIAPGRLSTYIAEHKARIEAQDKTVQWVEEDEDAIDGCRAWRLVYDVDLPTDEKNEDGSVKTVKVRTLQYIMDDHPRFYRVTCHIRADLYKRYLARFEACAHSFQRTTIEQVNLPGPQVELKPAETKK